MVQLWQETDPDQNAVDLVGTDDVPETGWKHVLEGRDENGRSPWLNACWPNLAEDHASK